MLKKIVLFSVVLTIGLVALTGCNKSNKDKLAGLGADIICLYQDSMSMMEDIDYDDEEAWAELEEKQEALEADLEKIIEDAGYEDMDEVEEAFEDYEDEDELKDAMIEAAADKCDADESLFEGAF